MNRSHILLLGLAIALTVLVVTVPGPHAEDVKVSELTFLTLEISDDGLTLVEWSTVPGAKNRARTTRQVRGISYVAQSASGITLWEGSLDDPRIIRVEFPDANGAMSGTVIRRETAQFTIRIPHNPMLARVAFFTPSTETKSGQAQQTLLPLGAIDWPATRQGRSR